MTFFDDFIYIYSNNRLYKTLLESNSYKICQFSFTRYFWWMYRHTFALHLMWYLHIKGNSHSWNLGIFLIKLIISSHKTATLLCIYTHLETQYKQQDISRQFIVPLFRRVCFSSRETGLFETWADLFEPLALLKA